MKSSTKPLWRLNKLVADPENNFAQVVFVLCLYTSVLLCLSFFLPRRSLGFQLAQLPRNPRPTYAILHLGTSYLGGSHVPLGRVESDKPLRLPGLSQWPIKDHRRTSVSTLRTAYFTLRINSLHLSSSRLAQESNPQ